MSSVDIDSVLPTSSLDAPNPLGTNLEFSADTSESYYVAVLATNSISVALSIGVIIFYFFLRRQHPRLMSRTTLKLTIALAATDLVFHSANLAGYGELPKGFGCAFVGGWMFAAFSMLSLFYACAIALNTQLVFVHHRVPKDSKQILFLLVPPFLTLCITIPTLAAGAYGYHEKFEYCWYNTLGLTETQVMIKIIFSYFMWVMIAIFYLVIAAVMIVWQVFSGQGILARLARRGTEYYDKSQVTASNFQTASRTNVHASLAKTLARKNAARRALTTRLVGYIMVPVICVVSGAILDIVAESGAEIEIPDRANTLVSALQGMMGSLNAILFCIDPTVLAVLYAMRKERRRRARIAALRNSNAINGKRRKTKDSDAQSKLGEKSIESGIVVRIELETFDDRDQQFTMRSGHTFELSDGETDASGPNLIEVEEHYHGL